MCRWKSSIFCGLAVIAFVKGQVMPEWESNYRLPSSTYPDHYDIYLHPDLTSKTYTGHSTIHINSTEARDYFIVHTKLLTITNTKLNRVVNGKRIPVNVVETFEYKANEFWVIRTDPVEAGYFQLSMSFSGILSGKIIGFYYSEYTTPEGVTRPLATTKFQPTYARQAFPCFDEPSFRSTFTITLVRPSEDYVGLSNMPVLNEVPDSPKTGLTEVIFEKSVSMVSYLVCFIVCDFTYKEVTLNNSAQTLSRAYAPSDRIDNMDYALEFTSKTLEYFEGVYNLPYPLPKSDMAAIPDYPSGATEHWGIVTYRETSILYNPNRSSTQSFRSLTSTISHELAHQWFGNLVTLLWWNDLWLNEGFATFISYRGVDNYHPSWDMFSQQVKETQSIFVLDSKLSSRPIVKDVNTPDEITAVFDGISYSKGSAVLRMLENFMGEKHFQKGITNFLEKYQYSNAITQNLWDSLTDVWKDTVEEGHKNDIGIIMDTWTRQMGYPLLTVTHDGDILTFTQNRFLLDPRSVSDPSLSPYGYVWDVPITILTPSGTERRWLYKEMDSLAVEVPADIQFYKVNPEEYNYYRVNYEIDQWTKLEGLCASLSLSPADRSNLYDDVLSLADAGILEYSVALNFTRSLANENHVVPWDAARFKLYMIEILLRETSALKDYQLYIQSLVKNIYDSLGFEDKGEHLERLLRYAVIDVACWSGVDSCLVESGNYLQSWIDDESTQLPIDTKQRILWWGMIRSGSNDTWNVMWERCLLETDATQRLNLYYGLSNSQDEATLLRYIELAQDQNNVKIQDFLTILSYISSNPAGIDLLWDWYRANWEWLVEVYTLNDRVLGRLIATITDTFSTQERLDEMNAFFLEYPRAGAGEQYREQAIETVEYNIYWVGRYSHVILDWLNTYTK